jgi:polar amino acid transport system substrate-binding protein
MGIATTAGGRIAGLGGVIGTLAVLLVLGVPAAAQTLDRIKGSGTIRLGFVTDERPFSFRDDAGAPSGYAVSLCTMVAERVKESLGLPALGLEWVPLDPATRVEAVQGGDVDLSCGATTVTLTRRADVSFSIPVFPSGTGALVRADAPLAMREILVQGQPAGRPIWRGSPARTVLERKTFSSVAGTTSEGWLQERISTFQLDANIVPVATYEEGIERVLDGSTSVLFGDMPILLDAAARSERSGSLIVLDRLFTYEPLALALPRDDEDFRLAVDRALSEFYASDGFRNFFEEWFGPPEERVVTFFRQTTLPD